MRAGIAAQIPDVKPWECIRSYFLVVTSLKIALIELVR